MVRLLAPLRRGPRPATIGRSAALLANGRFIAPDFAGRARSGSSIRGGFLAAGAALAGLIARGTPRRGLRLGQWLFLGATAVADHGEKISRDLVRGFGAGRIVLAQEIHQVRATHPVGKALGAAMAGRAIGRENRRAGFASLQIFGSRRGRPPGEKSENNQQTAANCGQSMPPRGSRRMAGRAPQFGGRAPGDCDL
jgi:hypothetical protein